VKSRHCATSRAPRFFGTGLLALAAGTLLLAGTRPAPAQTGGNTTPAKPITQSQAKAKPDAEASAKAAASYSLGLSIGTNLHNVGVSADALSTQRLLAGLRDALAGKATASAQDGQRVQTLIEQAHERLGKTNQEAAAKFLAENGKQPGVITTSSGLQYKVITPGAGASPKLTDEATVNYRGSLLDGTEFDSSYKRKEPVTFPVGRVIKGWTEALQLMKPGAKYELYIPPELAYGMQPPPQSPIPPGALLKFEVELISVKAAPASAPTSNLKVQ